MLGRVRNAPLLAGDRATSIAYILSIGFALAGHSSLWHLRVIFEATRRKMLNML